MKVDNVPVHIVVDHREKEGGKVLAPLTVCDNATIEIARPAVGIGGRLPTGGFPSGSYRRVVLCP
jgi:hypothetical protein